MKNKSGFTVTDHTADVGLRFWGNSFPDVLVNAARGMFSLIVDRRAVKPKEQKCFKIKGKDYEEVAINWLRELNFFHQNYLFLFKEFDVENVSVNKKRIGISAIAKGESIDLSRHFIKIDIKLVTYHKFYVKKINDMWEGSVIFDI